MTQENTDRKKPEDAIRASGEELSRLNRILQTLYKCNHALVHATDEYELFQSVCQILVEVGGLRLAWVGRCEDDLEKTVLPVAKAGYGLDSWKMLEFPGAKKRQEAGVLRASPSERANLAGSKTSEPNPAWLLGEPPQ